MTQFPSYHDLIFVAIPPGAGASRTRRAIADMLTARPTRVEKPRRRRKPTLASVAKHASKMGIEVARYEVKPDGTVVVVTGTPEPSSKSNPWLDDLNKVTKQ